MIYKNFLSKLAVVALFLGQSVHLISGAYCGGAPQPGERTNEFEIVDTELTFIRSVKNAMLFEAGPPNARFPVVHVWGTPYEMGYAQGQLMKKDITQFVTKTWGYLVSEVVQYLVGDRIPQWLKDMIISQGMKRALEWTRETTQSFTPQAYFDEVKGLSDATGLDYDLVYE
jgi:isopenicillin-N N-acyltransferase-like protein